MSNLKEAYTQKFEITLTPLASAIELHLRAYFDGEPRIDRINARAKSVDRFLEKAEIVEGDAQKYSDPLNQIQDQVGARIITFYPADVERVSVIIEKYYKWIEAQNLIPESEWEFGYFGKHYVLAVPSDVIDPSTDVSLVPKFFELQVKTLFQHAWSEASHDLGYKPKLAALDSDDKRQLAYTSAQAWGADRVFNELYSKLSKQA